MSGRLVLSGIYGTLKDEKFYIDKGQTIVLGRSRSCDIRLENAPTSESDEHASKHFQTISRKHLKITFVNDQQIILEDLSANGTLVDGDFITRMSISDIGDRIYTLLLGSREKFILEWEPAK